MRESSFFRSNNRTLMHPTHSEKGKEDNSAISLKLLSFSLIILLTNKRTERIEICMLLFVHPIDSIIPCSPELNTRECLS